MRSSILAFLGLTLAAAACGDDGEDACGSGLVMKDGACVAAAGSGGAGGGSSGKGGGGTGGTNGTSGGQAGAGGDSASSDFGASCTTNDDCTGDTDYCAAQPGA